MNIDNTTTNIANLMLDTNPDYSPELNDAINMHNGSIVAFSQGVTLSSLLTILIKKGIITEEEFSEELNSQISISNQYSVLENNRDVLVSCMEQDAEYMAQMKTLHDALENRDTDQINIFEETESVDLLELCDDESDTPDEN